MHYAYQAVDSVTGNTHVWTSETPDPSGTSYPGPNSPLHILQTNDPAEASRSGRGFSSSDQVGRVAVAGVAALRADSSLTDAGSIRLDYHTVPGYGGGDLYWDSDSEETDDNGTVFAVTGVTVGRWKRRVEGTAWVDWWGAVPNCVPTNNHTTTGADSTAAFQAAMAWANSLGRYTRKALNLSAGTYWVTGTINTPAYFTLRGVGQNVTYLWAELDEGDDLFVLGGLEPAVTRGDETLWGYGASHNSTLERFSIYGPQLTGRHAIDIPFCAYNLRLSIPILGGWTRGVSCVREAGGLASWVTGYDDRQGGGLIWCNIECDEVAIGGNWLAASHYYPTTLIYVKGFWTSGICDCNFWGHTTGLYIELPAGLDDQGRGCVVSSVRVRGSVQACTTGVQANCGGIDTTELYGELPTDVISIEAINPNAGGRVNIGDGDIIGGIHLRNTPGVVISGGRHGVDWDETVYAPVFLGGFGSGSSRTRANEICIGFPYNTSLTGAWNPGGFGLVDPKNIFLNGDFSRWTGADGTEANLAGWIGQSSGLAYKATKCGTGCADTTKTLRARNCALLSPATGDTHIRANGIISGALDPKLLGCYVTISLKYKIATGSANDLYLNVVDASNTNGIYQRPSQGLANARFDAESGFTEFTMTCLIVPLMVQYGMILQLWTAPNSGVTLYASEVQAAIGYSVPRWFDRCVERVGGAGTLREDGILEFPVASIPTSGTDPVFGSAHVVGDFARLRAPTFGTTEGGVAYTLTGWRYDGSVWQPQYTLGTMAASGSHIVDALIDGATSADVTLSTDAATTVASQLFSGWGSSKHFNVTLGFRATVWQSGDVTVSGSIDETVDCHVATDGSGVATVTIQGTQYPDATRLPGGLSGATAALATTTGGVTVQVTRPAGVACKSRARVFVARREEIS